MNLSPVIQKLTSKDVELLRAFRSIILQGKFDVQGSACSQVGSLFQWFASLDKRLEETLKPPPPEAIRKEVGIDAPEEKKKAKK